MRRAARRLAGELLTPWRQTISLSSTSREGSYLDDPVQDEPEALFGLQGIASEQKLLTGDGNAVNE